MVPGNEWIAPAIIGGATVVAAIVVLLGVLRTIASNERLRREDAKAQAKRDLEQREHDDERAAIAVRQAIRDRDFERIRTLIEPVMLSTLTARQGLERSDGDLAIRDVEPLVNQVIPRLELERDHKQLVAAIWELRQQAAGFRAATQVHAEAARRQDTQAMVRLGERRDSNRDAFLAAIGNARQACIDYLSSYARPVIDDPKPDTDAGSTSTP